jgi:hypothetical protein
MADGAGYPVIGVIALCALLMITARSCRHRRDIAVGLAAMDCSTSRYDVR